MAVVHKFPGDNLYKPSFMINHEEYKMNPDTSFGAFGDDTIFEWTPAEVNRFYHPDRPICCTIPCIIKDNLFHCLLKALSSEYQMNKNVADRLKMAIDFKESILDLLTEVNPFYSDYDGTRATLVGENRDLYSGIRTLTPEMYAKFIEKEENRVVPINSYFMTAGKGACWNNAAWIQTENNEDYKLTNMEYVELLSYTKIYKNLKRMFDMYDCTYIIPILPDIIMCNIIVYSYSPENNRETVKHYGRSDIPRTIKLRQFMDFSDRSNPVYRYYEVLGYTKRRDEAGTVDDKEIFTIFVD